MLDGGVGYDIDTKEKEDNYTHDNNKMTDDNYYNNDESKKRKNNNNHTTATNVVSPDVAAISNTRHFHHDTDGTGEKALALCNGLTVLPFAAAATAAASANVATVSNTRHF